jgi:small subunit ribosomal protein S15
MELRSMARMHARRKGKSGSVRPNRKEHPQWSSLNPREIESRVLELAKNGSQSSQIGMTLRDQYAVPDVRIATGQKISKILEKNNIRSEIPEDLRNLINKTLIIRKHLETNKNDLRNMRNLQLIESKIWRLTKYYQTQNRLPEGWKYSPEQAKLMFE